MLNLLLSIRIETHVVVAFLHVLDKADEFLPLRFQPCHFGNDAPRDVQPLQLFHPAVSLYFVEAPLDRNDLLAENAELKLALLLALQQLHDFHKLRSGAVLNDVLVQLTIILEENELFQV